MKEPVWVLREVVLVAQAELLDEFGGIAGIRDEGMLDSALSRPLNRRAYGKAKLHELAACYAYGLVRNHPFLDGNKRIGFTVAIMFLELNGYAFIATEADAALQTLALAAREVGEADYALWLKKHSRKAAPR